MFGNLFLKRLGYKRIKLKGAVFIIKKLTPVDFLDSDGVPFTLFHVEKPKTIYEKVMGDSKKDSEAEKINLIRRIMKAGVVKYPIPELDVEDYLKPETFDTAIIVYAQILAHTMSLFIRPYAINKGQLRFWDLMAKRYGRLPIECLMPNGGYSEVDAFIFNSFVLSEAVQDENREIKKMNALSRGRS